MKVVVFRIVSVILLLSLMVTIFCLSAQVATDSAKLSSGFSYKIISLFYPKLKEMTYEQQIEFYDSLPIPIRKLAHFSIFGLLGVFSFLTMVSYKRIGYVLRNVIAFIICVLYAVSDEIHQLFVVGRSCELRDVIIDSSGAFLGIFLLCLFCYFVKNIRKKII